MGKLTKEKIVKSMVRKKAYDIKYDFATEAVKDIDFKKCHKYSIYHYQTIYEIVKSKLNTLGDKNEKIAFLNCLWVNYTSLSKADIFDILISFLTGGFIGATFIGKTNDTIYNIAAIISVIIFLCFKIYVVTTRKWSFYDKIFEHLKSDIE